MYGALPIGFLSVSARDKSSLWREHVNGPHGEMHPNKQTHTEDKGEGALIDVDEETRSLRPRVKKSNLVWLLTQGRIELLDWFAGMV